jgi:hypothetical protein
MLKIALFLTRVGLEEYVLQLDEEVERRMSQAQARQEGHGRVDDGDVLATDEAGEEGEGGIDNTNQKVATTL